MAPIQPKKTISQEAFDEVVKENMEDLGMDPAEALQDAIDTLSLQGVDLSGIVTCVPGETSVKDNPVLQSLEKLKRVDSDVSSFENGELQELIDKFADLCGGDNSSNAATAARNGAVELVTSITSRVSGGGSNQVVVSVLKALASLLRDIQSAEIFQKCGGPGIIIDILKQGSHDVELLNGCFSVIAAAAAGNEILKESFVNLKVDELILNVLKGPNKSSIPSVYDAIRVLLASDDNRVAASQDEICRSVADKGGIDTILRCIDDSGEQGNKAVARTCCSLLCKLAGSDLNKSTIVEKGGVDRLIKLSARFADDLSVLQEVMYIINVLSLRNPDHASRALEAGAGDLAIQAMQKFPAAQQLQRNACFMIRNLVVRNPENRKILLNNGIEKLIRKAKQNHENCKDAATDALRDLGLDNYNV